MTVSIERIVVALDAASENRAAIDTAVRLAALWKAPLHGVFVEDDDLLRLANLPFARQVSLGTGVEHLTVQQTERQLRAFAEHARREVAAAAQRRGIAWSFDIVRGVPGMHATGVAENDFLVAGVATRPIGGHFRLECRWWSAIEPGNSSFLLSSRNWSQRDTVIAVIQNRGPIAERLLDTAARLAEANGGELMVICPAELSDEDEFAPWLGEQLANHIVPIEVDLMPEDPAALVRRIAELDGRLVVIAAQDPQAQPANLRQLVARTGCDVLVVR
jgi:nucleotide-binding universal stress UspA family protein